MAASVRRPVLVLLMLLGVVAAGAILRGLLVPADRAGLAPEAYGWRLPLPWAPKASVRLLFPAADGGPWIEVTRLVPAATPLAAVRELAAGPAPDSGLVMVFPAGTRVAAVTVAEGAATVTVEGWSPDPDSAAARLALSAVARTLQVSSARFAGAWAIPVTNNSGSVSGRVTYLWRGLPAPVPVNLPDGQERPVAAVRRLLEGEPPPGIGGAPAGVRVIGVEVRRDLAKVSLELSPAATRQLIAGRWEFASHAMAIVYTLTDLPGIRRVQFDFPGLPAEARRQCRTPLGVPLVRPEPSRARADHS